MLTLSSADMLAIWRRALGYDIQRTDCTVEIYEGINVDAQISDRMRQWYLHLLDTAPESMVPVDDFAPRAEVQPLGDGGAFIPMPRGARRPLSVKLSEWVNPAPVLSRHDEALRLQRMASPFARPGRHHPLAVVEGNGIRVYPAGESSRIERLLAVADPGPSSYILDESLLHIPNLPV